MKSYWNKLTNSLKRTVWRTLAVVGIPKSFVYRALGKSKLTHQQRDLLRLMRHDNSLATTPLRATQFWIEMNRSFESWLEVDGIGEVESQSFNKLFSGHSPSRVLYQASWLLYQNIKARDYLKLLEKVSATVSRDSDLCYFFEGNYVSWDLLISIDTLYSIAEVDSTILTEPVVVLDLGAGWGRMGYLIQSVNPKSVYIACDLPEGLLLSSSYLPTRLPQTKTFHYAENRTVKKFSKELLLSEPGIRFCGTHDIVRLEDKSVDFFINVASFQEMTLRQVDQYFDIIDRKVSGVIYIQEYWDGSKMGHTDREISGLQSYPFRENWHQYYVRNSSFSDRYFEGAFRL
jgi:putative sugar O-methyltransferase